MTRQLIKSTNQQLMYPTEAQQILLETAHTRSFVSPQSPDAPRRKMYDSFSMSHFKLGWDSCLEIGEANHIGEEIYVVNTAGGHQQPASIFELVQQWVCEGVALFETIVDDEYRTFENLLSRYGLEWLDEFVFSSYSGGLLEDQVLGGGYSPLMMLRHIITRIEPKGWRYLVEQRQQNSQAAGRCARMPRFEEDCPQRLSSRRGDRQLLTSAARFHRIPLRTARAGVVLGQVDFIVCENGLQRER